MIGIFIDAGLLVAILWVLSRDTAAKEAFFRLLLVALGMAVTGGFLISGLDPVPALAAYLAILIVALRFIVGLTWAGAAITAVLFIAVKIGIGLALGLLLRPA